MKNQDKPKEGRDPRIIAIQERIIRILDPVGQTPETKKERRNLIMILSAIIVIGIMSVSAMTQPNKNGKCPSPPPLTAIYTVPSRDFLQKNDITTIAKNFFMENPGAREIDVCAKDSGTILEKMHPAQKNGK